MKTLYWLPVVLVASVTASVAACSAAEFDYATGGGGGDISETTGVGGVPTGTGAGTGGKGNIAEDSVGVGGAPGAGGGNGTGGAGGSQGVAGADASGGAGGSTGSAMSIPCGDQGTPRTFYMSADDSSSMGSPTVAREYLHAKLAPPPALIRTYEFLNYYHVLYPLPADDKLGVHVHFADAADGSYRFQVGVQAYTVTRPEMSITFVVDTSGSLLGEGILREREAIKALASQLAAGDTVSFVKWANEEAEVLQGYAVSGPNDKTLIDIADGLQAGGGSDLHAGLTKGYALAEQWYTDLGINRVVLISDGGANLGVVDRALIAAQAKDGDDKGIHLVGVGVGPAFGYSDTLMNAVTDAGHGSYVYLDSVGEANEVLGKRFEEVMDIAARNVEIAVTIPSYFDIKTSSGEGYSQDKNDIDPQTIAPGDSMVLNQILTLLPEKTLCTDDNIGVTVTWNDPLQHVSDGENFTTWGGKISDVTGEPWQLLKAEAIFAYARALQTRNKVDFDAASEAVTKAQNASQDFDTDLYAGELAEIADLIASFPYDEMNY